MRIHKKLKNEIILEVAELCKDTTHSGFGAPKIRDPPWSRNKDDNVWGYVRGTPSFGMCAALKRIHGL